MLNFKEKPYGLLLITAIALSLALVLLLFVHTGLQDKTMFRIPLTLIIWIIPLFLMFLWLCYFLTERFLYSLKITWTHVLITVSTTILIVIILYIGINPSEPPSSGDFGTFFSNDRQKVVGNASRIVFILFVCGQFAYLVNILLGLIFTKRNKQQLSRTTQ